MGVGHDNAEFAEFFAASWDPCLRAVAASTGNMTQAEAAVLTALRSLPPRQREVIVLRVFLDLDIDTTARQLAIAPGTVRAHLSRAMTALRGSGAVTALRSELAPATSTDIKP
jgi:DNA-directed RNA polymerase specialized sigma24 family protein